MTPNFEILSVVTVNKEARIGLEKIPVFTFFLQNLYGVETIGGGWNSTPSELHLDEAGTDSKG